MDGRHSGNLERVDDDGFQIVTISSSRNSVKKQQANMKPSDSRIQIEKAKDHSTRSPNTPKHGGKNKDKARPDSSGAKSISKKAQATPKNNQGKTTSVAPKTEKGLKDIGHSGITDSNQAKSSADSVSESVVLPISANSNTSESDPLEQQLHAVKVAPPTQTVPVFSWAVRKVAVEEKLSEQAKRDQQFELEISTLAQHVSSDVAITSNTSSCYNDPVAAQFADQIYFLETQLIQSASTIEIEEAPLRGLVNNGNTCFRNVILQALLAHHSFSRLLNQLSMPSASLLAASFPEPLAIWHSLLSLVAARGLTTIPPTSPSELGQPLRRSTRQSVNINGNGSEATTTATTINTTRRWTGSMNGNTATAVTSHVTVDPNEFMANTIATFRHQCNGGGHVPGTGRGLKRLNTSEDAMEFLTYYLDLLHESLLLLPVAPSSTNEEALQNADTMASASGIESSDHDADGEWSTVAKPGLRRTTVDSNSKHSAKLLNTSTLVSRMFHGTMKSEVVYIQKKESSVTYQRFHCLSLDIVVASGQTLNSKADPVDPVDPQPTARGTSNSTVLIGGPAAWGQKGKTLTLQELNRTNKLATVRECISKFFEVEILDDGKISKCVKIEHPPNILILQLKRFSYDFYRNIPVKIQTGVSYDLELSLPLVHVSAEYQAYLAASNTATTTDASTAFNDAKTTELKYQLSSVILHIGNKASGGHYTAYTRNSNNQWHYFDDQRIFQVEEADVLGAAEEVYILMYSRV